MMGILSQRFFFLKSQMAGDIAQLVEHLPIMYKALNIILTNA